jgi:AraC family transcriptional regulator of adaptative response / DNA-3-methyladenine glycosylase II
MSRASGSAAVVPVRVPFHRTALLAYLQARAMPGVEEVDEAAYRRVISVNGKTGVLLVDLSKSDTLGHAIVSCDISGLDESVIARATALLDADTDVSPIEAHLRRDQTIRAIVVAQRGVRIPGTIDPFELAVRAILGQQISVAGARTLATRLVARYGDPLSPPRFLLTRAFPSAQALEHADLECCGITGGRSEAIRTVARMVNQGLLKMTWRDRSEETYQALLNVKGVGPWTASYVALRALGDADASMATDLGVRQLIGTRQAPGSKSVVARAAARWSPFRGYAAIHIWTSFLLAQSKYEGHAALSSSTDVEDVDMNVDRML